MVEGELVDEGVGLLRKAEEGNEATEVEARRLAEEKEVLEADKRKAKEEAERLRQELQELWAGFVVQKKELEAEYQKQVDDIFFYSYQYCMKKHSITQDTPSYPSNDEDEATSGLAKGKGDASITNLSYGCAWFCLFLCIFLFSFFLARDGPNEHL